MPERLRMVYLKKYSPRTSIFWERKYAHCGQNLSQKCASRWIGRTRRAKNRAPIVGIRGRLLSSSGANGSSRSSPTMLQKSSGCIWDFISNIHSKCRFERFSLGWSSWTHIFHSLLAWKTANKQQNWPRGWTSPFRSTNLQWSFCVACRKVTTISIIWQRTLSQRHWHLCV